MVYDLIVVGNGLAAQTFLFELFRHLKSDVKKSQNFSVAQIFSEEKTIYMISGFYKNGYSVGHLCAEKIVHEIF